MKLLSTMDQDELWAFWVSYRCCSRKRAEALLGRRYDGCTRDVAALAGYACNRATSMNCQDRKDSVWARIYATAAENCLKGLGFRALRLVYKGV